ncbi:hypothetical protein PUMCH_000742 [Australozyma saopauloensis]|uniref:Transcription regulator Rua1 C-terminal domain-containing protein n=1 Tax=Australozyma saopauloensis TaxID=291208 RepID=A0AAX4H4K5_9ASCO|nr:hypothetical protein PUMCH_000742 [[Candida] saopauloensis]
MGYYSQFQNLEIKSNEDCWLDEVNSRNSSACSMSTPLMSYLPQKRSRGLRIYSLGSISSLGEQVNGNFKLTSSRSISRGFCFKKAGKTEFQASDLICLPNVRELLRNCANNDIKRCKPPFNAFVDPRIVNLCSNNTVCGVSNHMLNEPFPQWEIPRLLPKELELENRHEILKPPFSREATPESPDDTNHFDLSGGMTTQTRSVFAELQERDNLTREYRIAAESTNILAQSISSEVVPSNFKSLDCEPLSKRRKTAKLVSSRGKQENSLILSNAPHIGTKGLLINKAKLTPTTDAYKRALIVLLDQSECTLQRVRHERVSLDGLKSLYKNYVFERNPLFGLRNPYQQEFTRIELCPITKEKIGSSRCALCLYCRDILFFELKNSNYSQHMCHNHGIYPDNYLTPEPLLLGKYFVQKAQNEKRKTALRKREREGVVCPVCYEVVEVRCWSTKVEKNPFSNYLRHFKLKHRSRTTALLFFNLHA